MSSKTIYNYMKVELKKLVLRTCGFWGRHGKRGKREKNRERYPARH
jgi:hypothetical protein